MAAAEVTRVDFRAQPALQLRTAGGARALVCEHGAQVLSWEPRRGHDYLYLSPQATFDGAAAIRGGVPVCFPQFARRGTLPAHGFARRRRWAVVEQRSGDDFALATFCLAADDATRALWAGEFHAELTVLIEDRRLEIELEVRNCGQQAFEFSAALHTYLAVGEVELSRLEGLHGHLFEDALRGGELVRERADALRFDDEVDRLYRDVRRPLLLRTAEHSVGIHAVGFPDCVVWNPWEARSRALEDLPDQDFRRMLCVEAAAAHRPVALAAGDSWAGRQTLVAL